MRVIITGGTGLIGRALANSLAADGHEVVALSRNPNKTGGLARGVKVVAWDGQSAQGWGELADGAGAIVHLAGESIAGEGFPPQRWTPERKKRIVNSRVNGGRAIVEAVRAAANKPGVVIQQSGINYYGTHATDLMDENHPAGDDFLADVCKQWEGATAEVEKLGVRRCVTRTGLVLSSKGGVLPMMALPFRLFVGGPIGSGKQPISWIHLDDEIAAIRFLIDHPEASGVFNLATPNPVTNGEFSRALGRALGRPSYFPTPGLPFKLAFGELGDVLLLNGQRIVPRRLLELGFQFGYPEIDTAMRDLFQNRK